MKFLWPSSCILVSVHRTHQLQATIRRVHFICHTFCIELANRLWDNRAKAGTWMFIIIIVPQSDIIFNQSAERVDERYGFSVVIWKNFQLNCNDLTGKFHHFRFDDVKRKKKNAFEWVFYKLIDWSTRETNVLGFWNGICVVFINKKIGSYILNWGFNSIACILPNVII